jgi:diguanylate cyclase (GGDEF)-like protein
MASNHSPFAPASDFALASRKALAYLHANLGMGLWMVTRVEGEDWIVLTSEDHGYGVKPGDVFRWSDSFCSRMVQGLGPRVAPVSDDVPAYRDAPIGRQVPIGAYVGVPLVAADGELFGTICAIDPAPQPGLASKALALAELLADLLSGILTLELKVDEAKRAAERAKRQGAIDELTGLFNRRGWNGLVAAEDDRCRRHGEPAAVVVIDVDGLKAVNDAHGHAAGDDLLRRCAAAIDSATRDHDVAARFGGDEFAVLLVEANEAGAARFAERLQQVLESAGVGASIGFAVRTPAGGLRRAVVEADMRMYEAKRARAESRSPLLASASGAAPKTAETRAA